MNGNFLLNSLNDKLKFIFEDEKDKCLILNELEILIKKYEKEQFFKRNVMDEKRAYLITYGDSIYDSTQKESPLISLGLFLKKYVSGVISDIHILPMFDYTSDDGFSLIDYMKVDPKLGTWDDVEEMRKSFQLMFDFVANHLSKQSIWFQKYLNQEEGYEKSFVEKDKNFDFSNVTRPRTSPLFHTYESKKGKVEVWTTFSEDQVDINFADPKTFVRICNVLLQYCLNGASSIRLDAIGFIWKEDKTSCISLPKTHMIISIFRELVNYFCENTQIITETNVPHDENVSYFGKGDNEANQVYQFALPPLMLHTFTVNNSEKIKQWASAIKAPSSSATFFNFLASHDGIGMRPVENILNETEKKVLIDKVIKNKGKISFKTNADGTQSAYELNINYSEALRNVGESDTLNCQKMLAAHHILCSLVGVPAIYYHSLFGSKNDIEGAEISGIARRINREKLEVNKLSNELENNKYRSSIFCGMKELLNLRQKEKAFNPYGEQKIIESSNSIFSIKRTYQNESVIAYTNVTPNCVNVDIVKGINLFTNEIVEGSYQLSAYEYIWVKPIKDGR